MDDLPPLPQGDRPGGSPGSCITSMNHAHDVEQQLLPASCFAISLCEDRCMPVLIGPSLLDPSLECHR